MPERSPMTTVGDTITVAIPKTKQSTTTVVCPSSAAATFTAILEVSADDGNSWETATFTKADGTTAASLTAAGVSGKFDSSGYTKARLRLTGINTPSTGVVGRINVVTSA